jgi:hypothetical protein
VRIICSSQPKAIHNWAERPLLYAIASEKKREKGKGKEKKPEEKSPVQTKSWGGAFKTGSGFVTATGKRIALQ